MKRFALTAAAALLGLPAAATTLSITITNDASPNGFALTPVYSAFHDGSFDSYTVGETASQGLRDLAELGDFSTIRAEREAATTSGGVLTSIGAAFPFIGAGGPRPIFGGESVTVEVDITNTSTQRYFSFLSMIIPSNDLFIGNGDPFAFELFDAAGQFTGPQVISLTGANIRDAGTEVNDPNANPAFVQGVAGINASSAADENGVVQADGFSALAQYVGLTTVPGFVTNPQQDVFGLASDFNVATISIQQVAPVPLPAGGVLLLSALGAGGLMARRKAKRR